MASAAQVEVRWATVGDARGVAAVHIDSWREAYRGLIDQAVLDALQLDQRAEGWGHWIDRSLTGRPTDGEASPSHRLVVAEADGRIAGWAGFGAGRDSGEAGRGELAGLYVHPDNWSCGVGHALLERAEIELRAEGWHEAYLWMLHGNERAARFYERHGWYADGAEKIGDAGGARELRELRRVRTLEGATAM